MRIYKKGKEHPQYNSIVSKCVICGKMIFRRPSEIKYGRKKCCSLKCMGKFRSLYFKRENHPFWKGHTKECIVCHKIFHLKPSQDKLRVTCSYQCMAKLYQERLRGKVNPNWRNGISSKKGYGSFGRGNKAYNKGKSNERKARVILQKQGFYVMRSGGSRGIFDLCAIKSNKIKLIQVKSNRRIDNKTKKDIVDYNNCPDITQKELWIFYDKKKLPQITIF